MSRGPSCSYRCFIDVSSQAIQVVEESKRFEFGWGRRFNGGLAWEITHGPPPHVLARGMKICAVAVDIALDAVKMMVFLREGTEFGEPFDEGEVFGEVVVVREERLSGGLGNAEYQAYLPDTIT